MDSYFDFFTRYSLAPAFWSFQLSKDITSRREKKRIQRLREIIAEL